MPKARPTDDQKRVLAEAMAEEVYKHTVQMQRAASQLRATHARWKDDPDYRARLAGLAMFEVVERIAGKRKSIKAGEHYD